MRAHAMIAVLAAIGGCRSSSVSLPSTPDAAVPVPTVDASPAESTDAADPDSADAEHASAPPSCAAGLAGTGANCGGKGGTEDCCETRLVPAGTYLRDYDGIASGAWNDPSHPATVSGFHLDTFEVTVGRFRAFVAAGMGTRANPPAVGSGAHPKIAGSGWTAALTEKLTATGPALLAALSKPILKTWTPTVAGQENLPMMGVTWYEAFAFCIWDGGRLPTAVEWNYAAAGGNQQRYFPWVAGLATVDREHASYDCHAAHDGGACSVADIPVVGSTRPGDGRWGHADLLGSVSEWLRDSGASGGYMLPCFDCADVDEYGSREARGNNFEAPTDWLSISVTEVTPADARVFGIGMRCARTP